MAIGNNMGASVPDQALAVPATPASAVDGPSGFDPSRRAVARCLEIIREVRDGFLSEEYATGQPVASFNERLACDQAAEAVENEFSLGTIEQCRLLGKPTPFEKYNAAIAMEAATAGETCNRLDPKDDSAGRNGIAQKEAQ